MKSAWWRAGAVLAAAILVATHVVAQPDDDDAIHVEFKVNGQTITLPDDVRDALRNQADTIVRHCGYDGGDQEAQMWREALAEPSSIRLVYATPISLRLPRREILISQATFSLSDAGSANHCSRAEVIPPNRTAHVESSRLWTMTKRTSIREPGAT